jgi:hypothetical protein
MLDVSSLHPKSTKFGSYWARGELQHVMLSDKILDICLIQNGSQTQLVGTAKAAEAMPAGSRLQ